MHNIFQRDSVSAVAEMTCGAVFLLAWLGGSLALHKSRAWRARRKLEREQRAAVELAKRMGPQIKKTRDVRMQARAMVQTARVMHRLDMLRSANAYRLELEPNNSLALHVAKLLERE